MAKRGKWIRTPESIENLSKAHIGNDSAHGKLKDTKKYENKIFGSFRVIKFLREEMCSENNKKRDYFYEVECINCGNKSEMILRNLQVSEANVKAGRIKARCFKCDDVVNEHCETLNTDESSKKRTNSFVRSDKATKRNESTGIKHLYKRYRKGIASYLVAVNFNKNQIRIIESTNYDKAKSIANELNEILKNGGKEAFYEWYESKIN